MFGELKLVTYQVEAILEDYVLRGEFRPRGDLFSYVNDRSWKFFSFHNARIIPIAPDRRIGGAQVERVYVNKEEISFMAIVKADLIGDFHLPPDNRQVTFYTENFVAKGLLHISSDAPDDDMLDDAHDFFALTEASIFPIRPVAVTPLAQIPMLMVRRSMIKAYVVRQETP